MKRGDSEFKPDCIKTRNCIKKKEGKTLPYLIIRSVLRSCFLKRSNLQQNPLPSISTRHRLRDINEVTKCRKLWALTTSSERTRQLIKQRVAVGNNGFHTRVATHRKRRIGKRNPDSKSEVSR